MFTAIIFHKIFYFLNILAYLYSFASVRVFSRLDDPYTVFLILLFKFFRIVDETLVVFVGFVRNMECHRQEIEDIFVLLFEKVVHVMEQCLLIAQMEVVLKMVVHFLILHLI